MDSVQKIKDLPILLITRALIKNKEGKFLALKRSKNDMYDPGKWEIPGGKVDAICSLEENLRREVLEETGMLVDNPRLTQVKDFLIVDGKYAGFLYVCLYYLCKLDTDLVVLSEEHEDYKWVEKSFFRESKDITKFCQDLKFEAI